MTDRTETSLETSTSALDALGRHVAQAEDEALRRADWIGVARQRVLRRQRSAARWRPARLAAISFAGAVAAASMVLWLVHSPAEAPIGFAVGSEPGGVGRWFAASTASPLPMTFSEGSVVMLEPSASARVEALGARGATVVLERGRTVVSVVHQRTTDWRVRAGPYEVRVTGTRFTVEWSPAEQRFGLALHEGAVHVFGGELGAEGRDVAVGQELVLAPQVVAAPPPTPSAPAPIPSATPAQPQHAVPAAPAHARPAPAPTSRRAAPVVTAAPEEAPHDAAAAMAAPAPPAAGHEWSELYRSGRYRDAWDDVAAHFEERCRAADAAELRELADLARLAGQPASAAQAWLQTRSRFPRSPEAAAAAFELGRRAFDDLHDYRGAAVWFGTCRAEQPDGPLAREAAGRILEARLRASGRVEARAAALEYLAEYPTGPHARMARQVLESE